MASIKQDIITRVKIINVFLYILAAIIIGRIVNIQWVQGEKWVGIIKEKTIIERKITAPRGNILSNNGSLLATSLPKFRVGFDANVADNSKRNLKLFETHLDDLCTGLSSIFTDKSSNFFKQKILNARSKWIKVLNSKKQNEKKHPFIILDDRMISFDEKNKLNSLPFVKEGKYKSGIVLERFDQRVHPFDNMGLRTVGYLLETEGKGVGLEKSMENFLVGKPGKGIFEKLKGGVWKPIEDGPNTKPIAGSDVHTTLDVNIQDETETALRKAVEMYSPNYASAIVMEVKTGEIKAMANLSFSKKENNYTENFNYAVAGSTTPGSTFKLPTMLALLEEGVNPSDSVETGAGEYFYRGKRLTDSKRGGFGRLTVQQVFEKSSNIGIVKLVLGQFGQNKQKYYDYLKKYRLDQKLGFQIKGEPAPIFYSPGEKGHSDFSMPWTAFGGIESSMTPLQMLTLFNAVANDGYWVQPIIVKYIKNADQTVVDFTESQRRSDEQIISRKTLKSIKSMLEGVVERGTAASQKTSIYKFAGKTGTAKKLIKGDFADGIYYTAFAGYFPADRPKFSIIVVIDEPKGKNSEELYAADVAAPVFREIADHIYADDLSINNQHKKSDTEKPQINALQYVLNTDYEAVNNQNMGRNVKKMNININANVKSDYYIVPNVVGLPLRDALYILENKNFIVNYTGIGKVQKQSVKPGTMLRGFSKIDLIL